MPKGKIFKYCFYGFLYAFLVLEITATSGLLDPRSLFWPSTPGYFTGMWLSSRFFGCYRYQYEVQHKAIQGSQLLPLAYKDTLKPGQVVRVYYDNKDPEKSFFAPGFNAMIAFCVLFVIILGICLLLIPVLTWVSASRKSQL